MPTPPTVAPCFPLPLRHTSAMAASTVRGRLSSLPQLSTPLVLPLLHPPSSPTPTLRCGGCMHPELRPLPHRQPPPAGGPGLWGHPPGPVSGAAQGGGMGGAWDGRPGVTCAPPGPRPEVREEGKLGAGGRAKERVHDEGGTSDCPPACSLGGHLRYGAREHQRRRLQRI